MDYLDSRLFITSNQQISKSSKGQPEDDEDDPEFRELDELDESESELLLFEPPLFFCFSPFEDELELELSSGLATVAADFALGFAFALPFGARFGKTFGAAGAATGTDAAAEEEAELVFFSRLQKSQHLSLLWKLVFLWLGCKQLQSKMEVGMMLAIPTKPCVQPGFCISEPHCTKLSNNKSHSYNFLL